MRSSFGRVQRLTEAAQAQVYASEQGQRGVHRLEDLLARYADQLSDKPAERERLRAGPVEIRFLDYDWSLNDLARGG